MDTREDDGLAITAIPASRLGHVLGAAKDAGADIAIIDTPPFAKDIAFEAAQYADLVLIPTRPAILDVMAMRRAIDLIKVFAKSASVLTFCPPTGKEITDTEVAVDALGASLCPVRIGTAWSSSSLPNRLKSPNVTIRLCGITGIKFLRGSQTS